MKNARVVGSTRYGSSREAEISPGNVRVRAEGDLVPAVSLSLRSRGAEFTLRFLLRAVVSDQVASR